MDHERRLIQKRRRPAYSCSECRRRKVKCDRVKPTCGQCGALGLPETCTYEGIRRSRPPTHTSPTANTPRASRESIADAPASSDSSPLGVARSRIEGVVSKTRVFGHGHWMNTFPLMENIPSLQPTGESYKAFFVAFSDPKGQLAETIHECKRLARTIKQDRPSRKCLPPGLHHSVPSRSDMDEIVELYFATFESCFGILCRRSFMVEYRSSMEDLGTADSSFILQLLLVATIAGPLWSMDDARRAIAANARKWIDVAQTWLSAPFEKGRLTIQAIQVHCLLLLSRLVNQVGSDLVWISTGALIRMAMQMGLHQDPDLLQNMNAQEKETRRRLWYTVLELNVQAALDSGMLPMITEDDYNTKPPTSGDFTVDQIENPGILGLETPSVLCQPILAKSLPLRIRIAKSINSMREEMSYARILDLGSELDTAFAEVAPEINPGTSTRSFATSLCTHLLSRFSLCLHYRYAVRAKTNPLYTHSRHTCLEAALHLVSLLGDTIYARILQKGGGMFRDLITRGALLIFLELGTDHKTTTSIFSRMNGRTRYEPLLQDARRLVQYAKDRVVHGDMNVKTYVCLSMMMAQAEARFDGSPATEAVEVAMAESLTTCREILETKAAMGRSDGTHPDFQPSAEGMVSLQDFEVDVDSDLDGFLDFDFTDLQFHMPVE